MVDCVPHDTIDWTGHSSARSSPVKRKKRRSTHSIRKEQKSELEKELQALQAKLEELELRALGERSYQHQVVQNATLRDSIQMQHMGMAQARALLSEYAQQTFSGVRPMRARICLGLDREERRRQLYALRGLKLRHAQNLVNARGYGLRPTTPYFQEEQFETEEGCSAMRLCVFRRKLENGVLDYGVNHVQAQPPNTCRTAQVQVHHRHDHNICARIYWNAPIHRLLSGQRSQVQAALISILR